MEGKGIIFGDGGVLTGDYGLITVENPAPFNKYWSIDIFASFLFNFEAFLEWPPILWSNFFREGGMIYSGTLKTHDPWSWPNLPAL